MKPATARTAAEGPVRVEFQVQFSRGPKGRRKVRAGEGKTEPEPESTPVPSVQDQDMPGPASPPALHAEPPPRPAEPPFDRVPKITLLLVLGHYFERLVRDGVVKDYADIARRTGLSRARVTQIVDLTLLAPEIQEGILTPRDETENTAERAVRSVVAVADWSPQTSIWRSRSRPR